MANFSVTAALFLVMSQSFTPVTATSNNVVLTDNNTPIIEIDATSEDSKELMANYLDIIENDAAIKAIFESDNVVAQTELVSLLQETLESKDEYKVEKAKKEAEEEAARIAKKEAERKAKEKAEHQKKLEEAKKLSSGNFSSKGVCSTSSTKSYMDYRKITSRSSAQWKLINQSGLIHVGEDGLLYSDDGFIGVALGSYYGKVGDKFKFVLSNGQELNVIKVEEKADKDTINGCAHSSDSSVIEFVVDREKAFATFGGKNGHPANGNFNNIPQFKGNIVSVYKYNG